LQLWPRHCESNAQLCLPLQVVVPTAFASAATAAEDSAKKAEKAAKKASAAGSGAVDDSAKKAEKAKRASGASAAAAVPNGVGTDTAASCDNAELLRQMAGLVQSPPCAVKRHWD
jgi:hypothetical protein